MVDTCPHCKAPQHPGLISADEAKRLLTMNYWTNENGRIVSKPAPKTRVSVAARMAIIQNLFVPGYQCDCEETV